MAPAGLLLVRRRVLAVDRVDVLDLRRRMLGYIIFRTPFIGLEVLACLTPLPPHGEGRKTFYIVN